MRKVPHPPGRNGLFWYYSCLSSKLVHGSSQLFPRLAQTPSYGVASMTCVQCGNIRTVGRRFWRYSFETVILWPWLRLFPGQARVVGWFKGMVSRKKWGADMVRLLHADFGLICTPWVFGWPNENCLVSFWISFIVQLEKGQHRGALVSVYTY